MSGRGFVIIIIVGKKKKAGKKCKWRFHNCGSYTTSTIYQKKKKKKNTQNLAASVVCRDHKSASLRYLPHS